MTKNEDEDMVGRLEAAVEDLTNKVTILCEENEKLTDKLG
jgi:hypothetical protein